MNFRSSSTEPSHGAPSKEDLPVTPDKREDAPNEEEGEGGEGTNTTQHHPDPKAKPMPEAGHKYVPRSPYGQGND